MIQQVSGDILLSKAQTIVHGVAPNDHFNQGLALALRERYPALYDDFRHYSHQQHPKEGTCWAWAGVGEKGQEIRVVSLFTQEHSHGHGGGGIPGKASHAHVNHALRDLAKWVQKEKITSLALPKLATGVGGMKWEEVLPLMETHLGGLGIPVIVYVTYQPGVAAHETL